MAPQRTRLAGLIPLALQTISLSNSTAVAANSTTRTARVLDISIETNNCRYRADGSAPTLSTGVVLWSGNTYRMEGYNGTANLRFQRTTGTSKVTIQPYRHPGD